MLISLERRLLYSRKLSPRHSGALDHDEDMAAHALKTPGPGQNELDDAALVRGCKGESTMRITGILIISLISLAGCTVFIKAPPGTTEETVKSVPHVLLTQNTNTIPIHEVFEITFQHDQEYVNPFFDVVIEVTFHSPSGKPVTIGGFHYGSSRPPQIHA